MKDEISVEGLGAKDILEGTDTALGLDPVEPTKPTDTPVPEPGKNKPDAKPVVEPGVEPVKEPTAIPADVLGEKLEVQPSAEPEIDTSKLNEKDASAFAALRKDNSDLKKRIEEAEKTKPTSPAETEALTNHVKELQEKLKQANDSLGRTALERSPDFIKRYDDPKRIISARMSEALKTFGLDDSVADRLLRSSVQDRIKIIEDVADDKSTDVKSVILPMLSEVDVVDARRIDELDNHAEVLKNMNETAAQNQKQQMTQLKERIFDENLDELRKEGHFAFKRSADNDKWNEGIEKIEKAAKDLLSTNDIKTQAKALMMGVASNLYLEMFQSEHQERLKLQKELESIGKVRPKIGSSPEVPTSPDAQKKKDATKPMSLDAMADSVSKSMGKVDVTFE